MMSRLGVFAAFLLLSAPVAALEPWALGDGGASLVDVGDDPRYDGELLRFRDAAGAEYEVAAKGSLYVSCRPSADDEWRSVIHSPSSGSYAPPAAGLVGDRLVGVLPFRSGRGWEANVWIVRCADLWDAAPDERLAALSPRPVFAPLSSWEATPTGLPINWRSGVVDIDGQACLGGGEALWCFDPEAPGEELAIAFETHELAGVIEGAGESDEFLRDLWPELFPFVELPVPRWRVLAFRDLPGGGAAFSVRLTYMATGQSGTTGPIQVGWIVVRHPAGTRPDGPWETRFETPPQVSSGTTHDFALMQLPSPIGGATEIHYDPHWDALWVGPVHGWQSSGIVDSAREIGHFGIGYRVLPLSEPGGGYLDLTEAWGRLFGCRGVKVDLPCRVHSSFAGLSLFDGEELRFRVPEGDASLYRYALVFGDRDAVDVDGDGLSRAEERGLGTSDFDPDYDGDQAWDGPEVVAGGDPTVADGPLAGRAPTAFIPSPLLAERLLRLPPAVTTFTDDLLGTYSAPSRLSARGPYCRLVDSDGCGACVDRDLQVVAEWCQDSTLAPQVSWDGTLLVYRNRSSLEALDLVSGERWTWATVEELAPLFGDRLAAGWETHQIHFYPVDRDNLWVANLPSSAMATVSAARVVHVDGDGRGVVVFDAAVDACEHGWWGTMDCEPPPERWQRVNTIGRESRDSNAQIVVGYHVATERLLVALGGTPESWILGVHRDDPPQVFLRSRLLRNPERDSYARSFEVDWGGIFPQFHAELADGTYHTEVGLRGPMLGRAPINPWAPIILPDHGLRFQAFWDDVVVDERGLEWVASERRLRPGDTLFLAADTSVGVLEIPGYMLYAIGPRGGANPLWPDPSRVLEGVTGMDIAADGRLCIADRVGRRLVELVSTADSYGVPVEDGRRIEDVDAIDCHWANDELLVLLDAPPRVERVTADGRLVSHAELDGEGAPADIIASPHAAAGWEVLFLRDTEPLRGYGYDQDGTRAEYRSGEVLDESGAPIVLSGGSLARAALRPDGRFIVSLASVDVEPVEAERDLMLRVPVISGLVDGAVPTLYLQVGRPHHALAQVPGGSDVDPWGADIEAPAPDEGTSPASDAGDTSGAQSDAGRDGGATSSGGGCAAAGEGQPTNGWSLVLLLLMVWTVWRRGARPRRPGPGPPGRGYELSLAIE